MKIKIKKIKEEVIRNLFENKPKEFYGGNDLSREGEGYCSSYVNMKWEMYKDFSESMSVNISKQCKICGNYLCTCNHAKAGN